MRSFLIWSFVAAAVLIGKAAIAAELQPNILLITADDLGCQLSCYGEKRFATPRLDALAGQGVRFENFYVTQASCSSSRSSMLTGRYPHQNGQFGLAHLGFTMPAGQKNLPALLKSAGYRTGIIGKLHVEPAAEYPWDWMPREKLAAGPTRKVRLVAERAREFFATARESGRPFFFYVNFFDPHGPYTPDVNQVDGLPEKPVEAKEITEPFPLRAPQPAAQKRLTAAIINTILRVDVGVGLLMDELKTAGLDQNTMVVFVGDNGLPTIHGKGTCYELGVRVPLLVRWPGGAKAGLVSRQLVSTVDLMPTILSAANVKSPEGLPGMPLQPLLRDQPATWQSFLFTEMNFHEPDQCKPVRAVRDDRFKLLVNLAPPEGQPATELFDLQADPGEQTNRADDPACRAARERLEVALKDWRQKTADPLLDAGRVDRWMKAAADWKKLPRTQTVAGSVVRIPEGELERLK